MKNNFRIILIAVFLAFFVFAVMIFSGLIPIGSGGKSSSTASGTVVIWGTMPAQDISPIIDNINIQNQNLVVRYLEQDPNTYEQKLLESFASGTSPDLFMLPDNLILKEQDQIYHIPYATFPAKTFQDTFIDGASVYLAKDGVLAIPLVVDPIVVYYNKDLLGNEAIAAPPQYWDQLFNLVPKLTKKRGDGTITQSTIALGSFDNIRHAKDILALLSVQSGNSIVIRDKDGNLKPTLIQNLSVAQSPFEAVVSFFIEFSSPTNSAYSWNRAMPNSRDLFTSGKLAFYIGRASELFTIESINPNLSFNVMPVFQTQGTNTRRTVGRITALAISKSAANQLGAFEVAMNLTSTDNEKAFAIAQSLPPARRDLLSVLPEDPTMSSFFSSAIMTRTWLDPDSKATDLIFKEMIDNVTSNKLDISNAVIKAQGQIELLMNNK